jgi:ArsR family transcriptional regulator
MKCNSYYKFFRNLANKAKIDILDCLKKEELSVNEISKRTNLEQSKISHALSNLKCCGLVNCERKGKEVIYSLNKKMILPLLGVIDKHKCDVCRCGGKK